MPTRKEVSKIKADYINSREKLIRSKISQKQLDLFDELFNKYLSGLAGKEFSAAEEARTIAKIERAVKDFSVNTNAAILNDYTRAATSLGDLNMSYFATMFKDAVLLDQIRQKTQQSLNKRLGLNEDGTLKRNGFIDKAIADKTIQSEIVRETKKAISNNYDYYKLKSTFEKIIIGTTEQSGIFDRYYNTLAKDILSSIDNGNSKIYADELGLKYAYYSGGLMKTSREFCIKHNGKIFSQDQIDNFKNDPLIQDMYGANISDYNPNELPGGYGCRHSLDYITADLAIGHIRDQNAKAAERNKRFRDNNNL